jgi:hypothetical protein
MVSNPQTIYIVSAIHCPAPDGINPHCYSITGAYANASAAQKAMLQKAKELQNAPPTHWHGNPTKGQAEWKEEPFKVEFKGEAGDFGICWVDERVLGVEEVPITRLKIGRFGMGHKGDAESEEWGMNDAEIERTLCSLLKF